MCVQNISSVIRNQGLWEGSTAKNKKICHFSIIVLFAFNGKTYTENATRTQKILFWICSQQSIVDEWHVLLEASSGTSIVLGTSCKWNNTSSHSSVFWAHRTASLM